MEAVIKISTNLQQFGEALKESLRKALSPEAALRPAILLQIVKMHDRIHVEGKASDGGQIGEYSKGYLAVRSGVFQNSPKISRGVNKGKAKNAGTFTESTIRLNKKTGVFSGEDKVGKFRPNFHRGTDKKVIASLTREMENDYAAVAAQPNGYGISFNNQHNYDKSTYVEKTYNKPIFAMTKEEESELIAMIEDTVNKTLNG